MVSMSGSYVRQNWQYNVDRPFSHPITKQPAAFLPNSPHRFRPGLAPDDPACIAFAPLGNTFDSWSPWAINADCTLLAIAQCAWGEGTKDYRVYVHALDGQSGPPRTLQGHNGPVESLTFNPKNRSQLVAGYGIRQRGTDVNLADQSTIIIWDLSQIDGHPGTLLDTHLIDTTATQAVSVIATALSEISLKPEEIQRLNTLLVSQLTHYAQKRRLSTLDHIHGRLVASCNSPIISNDGERMIIMPGEPGRSNGVDESWVAEIYSLEEGTKVQLVGHEDSIMWTGFSPSNQSVLTVCWDRTVRLWGLDGKCRHVWRTKTQNWTACFSPDEKWVVATSGDGIVHCWDTKTGLVLWELENPHGKRRGWCRAVDVSADGRWLSVGYEGGGLIGIVDLSRAEKTWVSQRVLGTGGVIVLPDPEEDEAEQERKEDGTAESPSQAEYTKWFITGSIECRDVQFLSSSTDPHMLGYQCGIDRGLEVYNLEQNTIWRCEPIVPPKLSPDADEKQIRKAQTIYDDTPDVCGFLGWKIRSDGMIVTVHGDGVRVWDMSK